MLKMRGAITRLRAAAVVVCASVIFDLTRAGFSGWVYFPECPNGGVNVIQQPVSLCNGAQSSAAFNQVAKQLQGWQQIVQQGGANQPEFYQPRPQVIDSREQLRLQSSSAYNQLSRQYQGAQQNLQQTGINLNQPSLYQYRPQVIDSRQQPQRIGNVADTQISRAYQGIGDHERIRRQVSVGASQFTSNKAFQERNAMQSLAGAYSQELEDQPYAGQQAQLNQFVEPKNGFQESLYPYRAFRERNAMQPPADLYSQGIGAQPYAVQQTQANQFVEPNNAFPESRYPYRPFPERNEMQALPRLYPQVMGAQRYGIQQSQVHQFVEPKNAFSELQYPYKPFPERNVMQPLAGLYPQMMGAQQYGIQQSQINQLAADQNEFQDSLYPLRYNTYGEAKPSWLPFAGYGKPDLIFPPVSSPSTLQMGQNMYGNLYSMANQYNQLNGLREDSNSQRSSYSYPFNYADGYCRCAPLCAINCQQAEPMPVPQQANNWMNYDQLKSRLAQFANQDLPTSYRSLDKPRVTSAGTLTATDTAVGTTTVGTVARKLEVESAHSTPFLAPAAPPFETITTAASASTTLPSEPSIPSPTQPSELATSAPQPLPTEALSSPTPIVTSEAPPSQIEQIKVAQSPLTYAPKAIKASRSILDE